MTALTAALILVVVSGLLALTWQWWEVRRGRDNALAAKTEEARHQEVAEKQRVLALSSLRRLVLEVQEQLRDRPNTLQLRQSILAIAQEGSRGR